MRKVQNNILVELHVPNLELVKDFYSKLGFVVAVENALTETQSGYLTMNRTDNLGTTLLNFYGGDDKVYNQSYFKKFPKDTKRGYAVEITIPVENIEELYKQIETQLKDNIAQPLKEMQDHEHIWKDFRLVDPFGFYIRFTELMDWGQ
ncbi:MAG: hypothetical protein WAW92_02965 [Minisyncoccia bacterium]